MGRQGGFGPGTAMAVLVVVACAMTAWPSGAIGQEGASVLDGVYTDGQASRGDDLFGRHCAGCHDTDQFSGRRFQLPWANRTVFDFYDFVATSMPESSPGSLTPQEYVDVIAYVLESNGYPDGDAELPIEPDALSAISIQPIP